MGGLRAMELSKMAKKGVYQRYRKFGAVASILAFFQNGTSVYLQNISWSNVFGKLFLIVLQRNKVIFPLLTVVSSLDENTMEPNSTGCFHSTVLSLHSIQPLWLKLPNFVQKLSCLSC